MEQFDAMLRELAKKEEPIVPENFNNHLQDILCKLPAKAKRRGLGAVKTVLIAAAACAALLCTAFAAALARRQRPCCARPLPPRQGCGKGLTMMPRAVNFTATLLWTRQVK